MKCVFVRIEEGGVGHRSVSCLLLSGERAQEFLENPVGVFDDYEDPRILDSWTVPEDLENATASDPVRDAFDALLALDAFGETPLVPDLFATIFEAGYQAATKKSTSS